MRVRRIGGMLTLLGWVCATGFGCAPLAQTAPHAADGASSVGVPAPADAATAAPPLRSAQELLDSIPAPDIPADLKALVVPEPAAVSQPVQRLAYQTIITSPDNAALVAPMQAGSLLVRLASTLPQDATGLERRMRHDEDEARRVLHAFGYYEGQVQAVMDTATQPAIVRLTLLAGPQYHVGTSVISYEGSMPEDAPQTLAQAGLPADSPALASAMLDAVEQLPTMLRNVGYPFARVVRTRYTIDRTARKLDACVEVAAGPRATMGTVVVTGTDTVAADYLDRLRTWQPGQLWTQSLVESYHDTLSQQGLFRSITLRPAREAGEIGAYDVALDVADAPPRTMSTGLKYDTDRGPGVQGAWEHRNVFGQGERLRAELELWKDSQSARTTFRKPEFLQRGQDFVAEAWMRNEKTDAFDQQAVWAGAGLERRLGAHWQASARLTAEGGSLREHNLPRNAYIMAGLPLSARYDSTDSLLNPVRGGRWKFTLAPYTGRYFSEFTATQSRMDGSMYWDAGTTMWEPGRLVLAARLGVGSLMKDGGAVPASLLFFSGGGGSVRGYAYQSLGPRDDNDDPIGGFSMVETSVELRIRITDTIGLVPFLDGGNVFEDSWPMQDATDLRWGAGLGLRYYTAIGPVRLDVAVPLNRRSGDAPWQVYFSIGQSF